MKIGTLLRILISIVALVLIPWFLRDKLVEAFQIVKTVDLSFFLLAVFIYFVSILFLSWRLHISLAAKYIQGSFVDTVYVSFMGIFFNLFLPSAIGGDAIKAIYLSKQVPNKADVFSSLVIDRLSGFCVVIFLALLSSAVLRESWNHVPAWFSWVSLSALLGGGIAVFCKPEIIPFIFSKLRFLPRRFQEKLNAFYDSLSGFFQNRPFLIRSLFISVFAQSLFITAYFFIGRSLHAPIAFPLFFMLVPMITIISMAPSVGGAGVREGGTIFLFSHYMAQEQAFAMTILIFGVILIFSGVGGIWYFFRSVIGRDRAAVPARQNS